MVGWVGVAVVEYHITLNKEFIFCRIKKRTKKFWVSRKKAGWSGNRKSV